MTFSEHVRLRIGADTGHAGGIMSLGMLGVVLDDLEEVTWEKRVWASALWLLTL